MKRSGRIPRRSPLRKGKRRPSETLRVYGGVMRIDWIRQQPCVITGRRGVEIVHVKGGGVSRKADAKWTVPMIPELHRELHRIGIRSFEARYNIDLELAAIACEQRWQAHLARA